MNTENQINTQQSTANETGSAAPAASAPENTKFCIHCGTKIASEAIICPSCGCQVGEIKQAASAQPTIVINNDNHNTNTNANNNNGGAPSGRQKDKWVAVLLCLFLGGFGAHKFYEGKIGMGILYIFTAGLFGIGAIIDFIMLLLKPNPYYV